MTRCTLLWVGAALGVFCANASAVTVYSDDFESGVIASQWSFALTSGATRGIISTDPLPPANLSQTQLQPTRFLGEFGGNDRIQLSLDLGPSVESFVIKFDAYLLRTWDGFDTLFGGPDIFEYNYNGTPIVSAAFSNGFGDQNYCPPSNVPPCAPETGTDFNQKDRLGFNVELEPVPGIDSPEVGTPMSLVYHFDSGPIPYSGGAITFNFLSAGLQLQPLNGHPNSVVDESWGIDNISVNVTTIPEPKTLVFMLGALALLVITRRVSIRR